MPGEHKEEYDLKFPIDLTTHPEEDSVTKDPVPEGPIQNAINDGINSAGRFPLPLAASVLVRSSSPTAGKTIRGEAMSPPT